MCHMTKLVWRVFSKSLVLTSFSLCTEGQDGEKNMRFQTKTSWCEQGLLIDLFGVN